MNDFLAQLYGTKEKIAAAQQAADGVDQEEEQLNRAVLEEIEKTAAAEGIDINELSDEDIIGLMNEYKAELVADYEKTAAAEGAGELPEHVVQGMQEFDLFGRAAAHAFYDEANNIQAELDGQEKLAGLSDEEVFEALAEHRADAILRALQGDGEDFVKEAAMEIDDEELDDLITERAAELLDEAGFDVDQIAETLVSQ